MTHTLHFLEGKYGGKKAFLKLFKSKLQSCLGYYNKYKRIDFSVVKRLVFVCKGNISRSPYGQYKAISCNISAASFGLSAETGKGADEQALSCSWDLGLSLEKHKSTNISDFQFYKEDLILCFEPDQATYLESRLNQGDVQISLAGLWSSPKRPYIADPYGLHKIYYKTCYTLINSVIKNIKLKLLNHSEEKKWHLGRP